MRAAYVRCSKGEAQDPKRQRADIEAAYNIDKWYEDIEGQNSRDTPHLRRAFQQLLADVRAGIVKEIVVAERDRFGTKNATQLQAFIWALIENNCKLFTAKGEELTGQDELSVLQNIISGFASTREQESKAERTISSKVQHAKQGRSPGGIPPYGLQHVCLSPKGEVLWELRYLARDKRRKIYPDGTVECFDGKGNVPGRNKGETLTYAPDPETAPIVRRMFEMYAAGHSPLKISQVLNREGVKMTGSLFGKQKVHYTLRNPAIRGEPCWNKRGQARLLERVNGKVQPPPSNSKAGRRRPEEDWVRPDAPIFPPDAIIPDDLWEAVQTKLSETKKGARTTSATAHLFLRGLLYCTGCGQPMRCLQRPTRSGYCCSWYCEHSRPAPDSPNQTCLLNYIAHDELMKHVKPFVDEAIATLEPFTLRPPHPLQEEAAIGDLIDTLEDAFEAGEPERQRQLEEARAALKTATTRYLTLPPEAAEMAREEVSRLTQQVRGLEDSLNVQERIRQREAYLQTLRDEYERWKVARDLWQEASYKQLAAALQDLIRIDVTFASDDGKHAHPTKIEISVVHGKSREVILQAQMLLAELSRRGVMV